MAGATFEFRNLGDVAQRLDRQLAVLGPSGERAQLMVRIGISLLRWVDVNFRGGGSLVGGWAPLRPLTIFGRRQGSSVPLADTGTLRNSFTMKATESEAAVGTAMRIAEYHQKGTGTFAGRGKYEIKPKRPGGALAFPAPPGFLAERRTGAFLRYRPGGAKGEAPTFTPVELPRLGTRRVAVTTAKAVRAAGLSLPKRGRYPKEGGEIQSFAVVKKVMHPGVPPRPMLPRNYADVKNDVETVVQDWFKSTVQGRP